jgi:hypothetical protein
MALGGLARIAYPSRGYRAWTASYIAGLIQQVSGGTT